MNSDLVEVKHETETLIVFEGGIKLKWDNVSHIQFKSHQWKHNTQAKNDEQAALKHGQQHTANREKR